VTVAVTVKGCPTVAVLGALTTVVVATTPPTVNGTEFDTNVCESTFQTDNERVVAVEGVVKLKMTLELPTPAVTEDHT
jgi:hypothetical protein